MNDTLAIKPAVTSTLDAANFGTSQNYPRVASLTKNEDRRQGLIISSLSPTIIRIAHQPRKTSLDTQRSLFAVEQVLTRLDASSNPIGEVRCKVAFQTDIQPGVTLAEWVAASKILIGALIENDGAVLGQIYNGES